MAIVAVAFGIAYNNAPGTIQARHMAEVARYIPAVEPRLRADPRFDAIHLSVYTWGDGTLMVRGAVTSDADLESLKQFIAASPPPRPVAWVVDIVSPDDLPGRIKERLDLDAGR